MTTIICPECAAGKHINCNGGAWDHDADQPATCQCVDPAHDPEELPVAEEPVRFPWDDRP